MSTDTQIKGDSYRRQLDASETYAKNNDLDLVNSIDGIPLEDKGVSGFRGKNAQEGTLGIFLNALESGKIKPNSVLLIESLDRLSRDRLTSALTQFLRILELGIEIITLTDNQKYSRAGLNENVGSLFVSLGIMFRANDESETKSKRLSAAWSNKRTNVETKILTKTCPAWLKYSEETKKFEIVEGRDKVIKTIFDMCINTGGLFSIARYLNENKIPVFGTGKLWYLSYVKKIIVNRSVIGEFQPHMMVDGKRQKTGEPIANYFPKIIDEQTYLLAQVAIARRTVNGKGRKGTNFTNLFSGFTYCGACTSKMMVRNRGGNHHSSRYLVCSNKMVNAGCQMSEWNLADFESLIFQYFGEINFDELIDTNADEKIISLENQEVALVEKLKSKELEIEQAMDFIVSTKLSHDAKQRFQSKLNDLDLETKNLTIEIANVSKLIAEKSEFQKVFNSSSLSKILEQLKSRENDYLFRSSLNQLLSKAVWLIDLVEPNEEYNPSDFNEKSPEVEKYRATFKVRNTRRLSEILESEDFKQFVKLFRRYIRITYKSMVMKTISWGTGASYIFTTYNNSALGIEEKPTIEDSSTEVGADVNFSFDVISDSI